MLFQLLLTKVSKGEVFLCLQKVDGGVNKGACFIVENCSKINPRLLAFYTIHPVGNLMGKQ